jgi:hypothetical protein
MDSDAGRAAARLRRTTVEPLFGQIKSARAISCFTRRGLTAVHFRMEVHRRDEQPAQALPTPHHHRLTQDSPANSRPHLRTGPQRPRTLSARTGNRGRLH